MEPITVCDQQLVDLYIKEGKDQYIETLVHRHKDRVYTYIVLILKDQHLAEDIFQETFIKVINSLKLGKYQEKGIFLSWVMRIAHNLIIDLYRKNKNLKTISKDELVMDIFNNKELSEATIEDQVIQEQVYNDVKKLVDELPEEQKQVIMMRFYGKLSFKEIADMTNVSINTALGRMRYALINLRKLMEQKHISLAFN